MSAFGKAPNKDTGSLFPGWVNNDTPDLTPTEEAELSAFFRSFHGAGEHYETVEDILRGFVPPGSTVPWEQMENRPTGVSPEQATLDACNLAAVIEQEVTTKDCDDTSVLKMCEEIAQVEDATIGFNMTPEGSSAIARFKKVSVDAMLTAHTRWYGTAYDPSRFMYREEVMAGAWTFKSTLSRACDEAIARNRDASLDKAECLAQIVYNQVEKFLEGDVSLKFLQEGWNRRVLMLPFLKGGKQEQDLLRERMSQPSWFAFRCIYSIGTATGEMLCQMADYLAADDPGRFKPGPLRKANTEFYLGIYLPDYSTGSWLSKRDISTAVQWRWRRNPILELYNSRMRGRRIFYDKKTKTYYAKRSSEIDGKEAFNEEEYFTGLMTQLGLRRYLLYQESQVYYAETGYIFNETAKFWKQHSYRNSCGASWPSRGLYSSVRPTRVSVYETRHNRSARVATHEAKLTALRLLQPKGKKQEPSTTRESG